MNGSRTKHGLWLVIALAVVLVLPLAASATTPRNDDTPGARCRHGVDAGDGARSRCAGCAPCARRGRQLLVGGAHALELRGRVYPEMGNGGYTSAHSDVYIATTRSRTCSSRERTSTSR